MIFGIKDLLANQKHIVSIFEQNFPKDKFPNADYEGMCREMFFGNDNENYNCAYGETSCEKMLERRNEVRYVG